MSETEAAQQYRLRWNNHSASIVSEFEVLLGQEDFVDVTISCDKKSFKAHKVVLSACSSYFRKLLKDNPCKHPVVILRDVGDRELADILYFMYHGHVMVEQNRIPKLLQMAKMLQIRGLSDIKDNKSSGNQDQEKKEEAVSGSSFLSGLLSSSSGIKRAASQTQQESTSSNSSQLTSAKRTKTSPAAARPVPMLQSILSKQHVIPVTKVIDASKTTGGSTIILTNFASKAQTKTSLPSLTSSPRIIKSTTLTTSLESLLGGLGPVVVASDSVKRSNDSAASTSSDDMNDKEERNYSILGDTENSNGQGEPLANFDSAVEVKDEPLADIEDDLGDDSSMQGSSIIGGGEGSESDAEFGCMNENSRGHNSFSVPLLAQHLGSPNLLSASAKLRAAATQAQHHSISNDGSPIITQVISGPSSPPDTVITADVDPLGGDPPRKLAFHEPRPCPICRRMYRDAATLRTHTAIMHAEGRDPFACLCGELFRTKYEMYNHKKNGHR